MNKRKIPIFIWLLLALFFIRAVIYMSFTPPWQGPDEPHHYDYIHYLQTEKKLPELGKVFLCSKVENSLKPFKFYEYFKENPNILSDNFSTREQDTTKITHFFTNAKDYKSNKIKTKKINQIFQHPPLYYIIGAGITWPFKNDSLLTSIYILRLMGAFLGLGVVLFTYLSAILIFEKNNYAAYSAAIFVALNPMFTHITTVVNNDSLGNFLFVLFFYLLIRTIKLGLNKKIAIAIGLTIAAGLLTKFFFVITIPILSLVFLIFAKSIKIKKGFNFAGLFIPIIFISPYYLRNFFLYDVFQPRYFFSVAKKSKFASYTFYKYLVKSGFNTSIFNSFFSNFGWTLPRFSSIYTDIFRIIFIVASLGLVIYIVKLLVLKDYSKLKTLSFLIASFVALYLSIALSSFNGAKITGKVQGAQGRYLFSFIGVIGLMLFLGIRQFIVFKSIRDHLSFFIILSAMVVIDYISIFYYIIPYFYL